jgi:hypothetical protein
MGISFTDYQKYMHFSIKFPLNRYQIPSEFLNAHFGGKITIILDITLLRLLKIIIDREFRLLAIDRLKPTRIRHCTQIAALDIRYATSQEKFSEKDGGPIGSLLGTGQLHQHSAENRGTNILPLATVGMLWDFLRKKRNQIE